MDTITCPTCQLKLQIPLFHCVRCSHPLLSGTEADGVQVILRYVGGVVRTLAIYENQQPVVVEDITIEGLTVYLTLKDGSHKQQPASSLFNVLCQGTQLWNLK